ncbi:MAG: glycosyltransferase family 2 protein [Candidatus Hodarchaeota archaeon]
MPPLVSILIPAFNAQLWIADTILSALSQTCSRKEIIVVDDGSTDATLNIARQYESSTLKVIHQENEGACRARNRALQECQGEYIQWLDADDLLAADKIEQQLIIAETLADPDVLFTSSWGRFYYRPNKKKFRPTPIWQDHNAVDWLVLRLANPWMMPSMGWLVNRELTEKAGPWEERLVRNQDGEYFFRIVSLSRFVKFVSESRCYYRMANPSSVSRSTSRKTWESLCLSMNLTISHVLKRENSERTRTACVKRLNMVASILDANAPGLADRLYQRITELGGEIVHVSTSKKYAFIQKIIGERNARLLKQAVSRIHFRIYYSSDYWMAKLFSNNL